MSSSLCTAVVVTIPLSQSLCSCPSASTVPLFLSSSSVPPLMFFVPFLVPLFLSFHPFPSCCPSVSVAVFCPFLCYGSFYLSLSPCPHPSVPVALSLSLSVSPNPCPFVTAPIPVLVTVTVSLCLYRVSLFLALSHPQSMSLSICSCVCPRDRERFRNGGNRKKRDMQ